MYKYLIITAIIAIALLLIVTVILVIFNWSDKLYSPLLSLTLAGTVTTFITVLLMLKSTETESSFSTLVVVNNKDYLVPAYIYPENQIGSLMKNYFFYHHPECTVDNFQGELYNPKNQNESTKFNLELIQYDIFKTFINSLRGSTMISTSYEYGVKGKIEKPFKLTELDEINISVFKKEYNKNRFSKNPSEMIFNNYEKAKLPRGFKLEFNFVESSEKTGPAKAILKIFRPYYFTTEIIIEASFGSMNASPKELNFPEAISRNCNTYMYIVTVKTYYEKLTAGNWRTEEFKACVSLPYFRAI